MVNHPEKWIAMDSSGRLVAGAVQTSSHFQLQVIEQEPPSKDDQDEDDGHGEAARRSRRRRCL